MKQKTLLFSWLLAMLFSIVGASPAWAQATVGTTLWSEDWTGGTAEEKPSQYGFEGTSVYGGATLTYAQSSTNTKLYAEVLAGGTSPELLLAKSSTTWTISNIPTGQATAMTLTFKSNKTTFNITSSTTGISISGSGKSWTISQSTGITSFNLTFTNTGSSNARIDDISLTVKTAGSAPTTCATPSFSPSAGAVTFGTAISISSATAGSTIYYTTNGDDPTTSSTVYDSENKPSITASTTIKAIAVKDGLTNSSVGSASYTVKAPDAPVFSVKGGIVEKGSTITLTSASGTTIRYTTDGTTTPTASVGTVYSSAITINADQTIKAIAYDAGGNCSSVASYAFTAFEGTVVTFDASSDTGTSLSKDGVTFTTSATESSVYKWYKSSNTTFAVNNGKIKRIEFTGVSGYAISNMTVSVGSLNTSDSSNGVWTGSVASVKFTASSAQTRASKVKVFYITTATPTFSVDAGEYSSAQNVELNCATDGASIYYTTDGSTPTSSSSPYSSAIPVATTTTLKAIAIYDGVESAVASATYTMNRPTAPTFDVAEGVFDAAFDLHLSAADGTTIYYTTDGSTPTSSSSAYSTKVSISAATTTVKAIAVKDGLTSDVSSATYTYDSRTTPTFTLSLTEIELQVNETSSAITLTTSSDATPSFSCEDAHVTLTGTGNSRTISANAAGVYTVNVSVTGSATYKDAAGTITVTVTKKATTMVLTPSFTSKDLYVTTSGSLTGAPQYNSSNIVGAEVTYSSSDETVATIAANGTVTFRKAGSTTITASYAGNDEYESCQATYVLDLTDSTPQETEVDITFGNALYGTSYTGANAAHTGPLRGTVNNIDIVVTQGSGANLYVTNSETRIYGGATKGTITISAPTGYVITKIVFNGGNKPSKWDLAASPGTLSSVTWTGSASTVVFSASGRSDLTTATVTLGSVVTLSSACFGGVNYYGTYSNGNAFIVPEGLRVSAITYNTTTKKIELDNYSTGDIVAAGEGVLVSSTTYGNHTVALSNETGTSKSGNLLVGTGDSGATASDMSDTNYYYYRLTMYESKPGFWWKTAKGDGFALAANRAYLKVSKETAASARGFNLFNDEDETTGIHSIENGKLTMENGAWYTLGGQKMNGKPATKGIYIINGKKVVVK